MSLYASQQCWPLLSVSKVIRHSGRVMYAPGRSVRTFLFFPQVNLTSLIQAWSKPACSQNTPARCSSCETEESTIIGCAPINLFVPHIHILFLFYDPCLQIKPQLPYIHWIRTHSILLPGDGLSILLTIGSLKIFLILTLNCPALSSFLFRSRSIEHISIVSHLKNVRTFTVSHRINLYKIFTLKEKLYD